MQSTAFLPTALRPLWIVRPGCSRLVLGAAALGAITAAGAWQWSWLVAVGAAPLLLSAAPCAAMCGLGLCMHRKGNRSCGTTPRAGQAVQETLREPSTIQET
jgi:hypothetical protein